MHTGRVETLIVKEGPKVIDRLLSSERAKVIAVILVVGVGTAITAKNVISYPTECMREEMAQVYKPIKRV